MVDVPLPDFETLNGWAETIGEHAELSVGLLDKIFLPYSSRKLRDAWIREKITYIWETGYRAAARYEEQKAKDE